MKTSLFTPQNAEQGIDAYKQQALRNITGLVNSDSDPTALTEPLRDEITDWFLLDTKTVPGEAQLAFIIRSLIAESLKSGGIAPARVEAKLKSAVWADEQYRIAYDGKTGKKSAGFMEVLVDANENPNLFGSVDFDDEYEDYAGGGDADSGISRDIAEPLTEICLSKETILERFRNANAMQEQVLNGDGFSISDLKNVVPLRAEGDCEKTAHENTNALMVGLKRLPGLGETLYENIAGNGLRRTLNNDFFAKIAEFDNAPIDGGAFRKTFAAYEAVRYLCKGVYSLWVLAAFGMKPTGKPVWANRARKVCEAVKAIDGRNLIAHAANISDPGLVKAGAPKIDADKLWVIYAKIKSVAAEAEPVCLKAEKARMATATKSQKRAIREIVSKCENEIKDIWSFGLKPSFDISIEEAA